MPHDVFISYAAADKPVADAACAVLERSGLRCWIAPRDATPGLEWGAQIIRAINESSVMVLVYSRNANNSQQVKREVERAVSKGVAIVPFRIENVPASETLEYFISTPHWLDALTPPLEQHLRYLADTVALLKGRLKGEPAPVPGPPPAAAATPSASRSPARRRLTSALALAAALLIAVVAWFMFSGGDAGFWRGTWATDNRVQGLPAHWTLAIDGDDRYRSSVETRDAGTIRFNGSAYRMTSENGPSVVGSFSIQDAGNARIAGPLGSAVWQRDQRTATSGATSPVGVWTMNTTIQQVPWVLSLAVLPNGRFELTSRSEDSGTFVGGDGTWSMNSSRGFPQSGTYTRVNERTVTMTGPLGTATWTKQR